SMISRSCPSEKFGTHSINARIRRNLGGALISRSRLHGNIDLVRGGKLDGARVAGIGVAKDASTRVARENTLKTAFGIVRAVSDDDHTGMLGKADADTATVVNRYPRCTGSSVYERVEQRPIGDCIATVEHAFRFAIRRCDGAGIEMIPAD